MRRDHKLDLSGYRPSTNSTIRPDRDRSRSPKRPRPDSWRPPSSGVDSFSQHNGRRWRGKPDTHSRKEFRERSPILFRERQPRKRPKKSHKSANAPANGTETRGLSDKIHSLRRLLEKATDMPADIRQEKERELQGYVADQQRRKEQREKSAVTSRYHFVRFLERKKAERRLKQLERDAERVDAPQAVADTGPSKDEDNSRLDMDQTRESQVLSNKERLALQEQNYKLRLHEARVDLNYTLYAPLDQKYISLYPDKGKKRTAQDDSDGAIASHDQHAPINREEIGILSNESGQKPPLWYEVEKAMKNGTLELLRDGKIAKSKNSVDLAFRIMAEPGTGKGFMESGLDGDDGASDDDFFER